MIGRAQQGLEPLAALMVRMMELVSRLHRVGIVHGDLKPANIIVDSEHAPHVIDFGLSSRLGTALDARLSGSGTPLYMAPELFHGQRALDLERHLRAGSHALDSHHGTSSVCGIGSGLHCRQS